MALQQHIFVAMHQQSLSGARRPLANWLIAMALNSSQIRCRAAIPAATRPVAKMRSWQTNNPSDNR
jgi:hypothetical protein